MVIDRLFSEGIITHLMYSLCMRTIRKRIQKSKSMIYPTTSCITRLENSRCVSFRYTTISISIFIYFSSSHTDLSVEVLTLHISPSSNAIEAPIHLCSSKPPIHQSILVPQRNNVTVCGNRLPIPAFSTYHTLFPRPTSLKPFQLNNSEFSILT